MMITSVRRRTTRKRRNRTRTAESQLTSSIRPAKVGSDATSRIAADSAILTWSTLRHRVTAAGGAAASHAPETGSALGSTWVTTRVVLGSKVRISSACRGGRGVGRQCMWVWVWVWVVGGLRGAVV